MPAPTMKIEARSQAPFCGNVSKADTVFSNFTRCNGAPLCLIAQACLSSNGQRAFNIENTWLFSLLAFFIASSKPSIPFRLKRKFGQWRAERIRWKIHDILHTKMSVNNSDKENWKGYEMAIHSPTLANKINRSPLV